MKSVCKKICCVLLVFVLFIASTPFVWGLDAPIVADGHFDDWENSPGFDASDGTMAAEIKAANNAEFLYLFYAGDWKAQVNFSVDVFINGSQAGVPFDAIRINADVNEPAGTLYAYDSWNRKINDASGAFKNGAALEIWGYESLFFEVKIPLDKLGYADLDTPEITLNWTTFGDLEIVSQKVGGQSDEDVAGENQSDKEAVIPDGQAAAEENEDAEPLNNLPAITESEEEAKDDMFSVGGGFLIDGYYAEWDKIVHTEVREDTADSDVFFVALLLQGERLYVHLQAAEKNGRLPTDPMYLYVNANITYDEAGVPQKNDAMRICLAEVGDDMTMGKNISAMNSPEILLDLGAFECEGLYKRYLGEAAFTVHAATYGKGDECEFYIEMSEIAGFYKLEGNEISEVAMYFPALGVQLVGVTKNVSTGPYIGLALSLLFLGGYLLIKRKKRENIQ